MRLQSFHVKFMTSCLIVVFGYTASEKQWQPVMGISVEKGLKTIASTNKLCKLRFIKN